jgi:ABC-type transporter Mla subunit MlaD
LSLSKKLTWAIADRKRFERLMTQLHQINSSLLQLVPDTAALVVDSLSPRINELTAQVNELTAQVKEMRKPRGLFWRFRRSPKPNGSEGSL